jgi:hypothetical protein
MNSTRLISSILAILLAIPTAGVAAQATRLDRPPRDDEVHYAPADDAAVATNPPAFVWLPVDGVQRWIVEYAQDKTFPKGKTIRVSQLDTTVHVPGKTLAAGQWYWRYGYEGTEGPAFSRTRAFTIPKDAVEFPFPAVADVVARIPATRPRAYVTPADVAKIRNDPDTYKWLIDPVVRQAQQVLERNEPLFQEPQPWETYEDQRAVYNRTWRAMRPYTRGMEICARAYLYTGQKRFAEEAKRRLMHFMTWDVDGPSSVYWPTELGMDIAEHAPRTFDWIYDALSEAERAKCIEVLGRRVRQINEMHRSRPFESKPFSSHPGRMIGFAVEGSIILAHEVEDAAQWLEYTLRVLWSVYPAWGRNDGGWHEGISYWGSYMGKIVRVVAELDRLGVPLKDKPFFRNTGDFGLYAAYPHRPTRSFGDGYEGSVGSSYGSLLYSLASLHDNPYYRWYAEQTGGGPTGPEALLAWKPHLKARPPADLPKSRAFHDVGWVAMHSDMANPKDNVLVLFQSSPLGAISHNHANQNAFVVEAFGEPLAISSGYYHDYGDAHHREWVWQTRAHNAILVNGQGQRTRSAQSRGRIASHIEAGDWAYALGDATAAYGGRLSRAYRHILFLRPRTIIIADDLAASGEDATYQWLLHARRKMAPNQKAGEVVVRQGNARMHVRFLSPDTLTFSQRSGWEPSLTRSASEQFHFQACTGTPTRSQRFVTVLTVRREGEEDALPSLTHLDAAGGMALRVGDRTVLMKDPDAKEVRAAGHATREAVAVISTRGSDKR